MKTSKSLLTVASALLCASMCSMSAAQNVTTPGEQSTPTHKLTKLDFSLLASDYAVRNVDAYSTHWMLQDPHNHEKFLPDAISHHQTVMFLYSNAVVQVDRVIFNRLRRKHPKVARVFLATEVLSDGYWAFHNFTLR